MLDHDLTSPDDPGSEKRLALTYLTAAFAEAEMDGLDSDVMVQAALFEAFRHLVAIYGEEATATYAETFPDRIRGGGFSIGPRH